MSAPLHRQFGIGTPSVRRQGFTLVELLVVIGIMIILMGLLIPAINGISGGVNVTSAAEQISATISLARQRATSSSHNVSIRFYRSGSAIDAPFKSYQLWEQSDLSAPISWKAVDREQQLQAGLIVSPDATFSSILTLVSGTDTKGRKYAEFFFTPKGSITAPKDKACLTVHAEAAPKTGGKVPGLPPNFATVSIEPFNGRPKIYRP